MESNKFIKSEQEFVKDERKNANFMKKIYLI
ncbi:MAG: hypothetical protein FD188_3138 [Ignavibacteria bacterium]|nr:MAG: hypothetical protein FD188_3138 [Ignavibacteria bacterium]